MKFEYEGGIIMKIIEKLAKIFLILIIGLSSAIVAILAFLKVSRWLDFINQRRRMAKLKDIKNTNVDSVEKDWVLGQLKDNTPINKIQVIGTHNSSHSMPDIIRTAVVALKDIKEAKHLRYGHKTLTEQLDIGVRNIEMDIRCRKGYIENNHVPLFDDHSHCPDFELGLEEIKRWSDLHPDHVPISILLELKDDHEYLDPFIQRFNEENLVQLSEIFLDIFGEDRMITPDGLRVDDLSLDESIKKKGWPTYGESKGKIMVMIMDNGAFTPLYMELFPDLRGSVLFADIHRDEPGAVFLRCDNPFDHERMTGLLKDNVYVRTMAYTANNKNLDQLEEALNSGATIISTDFPEGHEDKHGRSVGFGAGKMIRILE